MVFEQDVYIGDSEHSVIGAPTSAPTPLSPSDTVRVETLRVAYEEEIVSGVLVQERMVEALALMEAAGANAPSHAGGSHLNEAEPRSIDAPS
jgi:hypothetical protein